MTDYLFQKKGLTVLFKDKSMEVPVGSTYHWDFGDLSDPSSENNPSHTYVSEGIYSVKLTITKPDTTEFGSITKSVVVSGLVSTTLSKSIYDLIDSRIPAELGLSMPLSKKVEFIEKWQLYLQPLVNHDIPVEEYSNELYYEALENQLIMELAAYDFLSLSISNLAWNISNIISESSKQSSGDNINPEETSKVKKIVTGPSEVEFFDTNLNSESLYNMYKILMNSMQPGGVIDTIKKNLCMLSNRIQIYLPICQLLPKPGFAPEVANIREPGLLGGPNPTFPLNS